MKKISKNPNFIKSYSDFFSSKNFLKMLCETVYVTLISLAVLQNKVFSQLTDIFGDPVPILDDAYYHYDQTSFIGGGRAAQAQLSGPELRDKLNEILKGPRLRHSEDCDPNLQKSLFHTSLNLNKDSLTSDILAKIEEKVHLLCDARRYMYCDPQRKRCVCSTNSIWYPNTPEEIEIYKKNGSCRLLYGSRCYESMEKLGSDVKNPLKIHPPFLRCIPNTSCKKGVCACDDPNSEECATTKEFVSRRFFKLLDEMKDLPWSQYNEPCVYRHPQTFDTRVHTLRDLYLSTKAWKNGSVTFPSKQLCNFTHNLYCTPNSEDYRASEGTCKCRVGWNWHEDIKKCVGREGSFCHFKVWAESDSVSIFSPCAPKLTCSETSHPETKKIYHVCCYRKQWAFKVNEYLPTHKLTMCLNKSSKNLMRAAHFIAFYTLALFIFYNF